MNKILRSHLSFTDRDICETMCSERFFIFFIFVYTKIDHKVSFRSHQLMKEKGIKEINNIKLTRFTNLNNSKVKLFLFIDSLKS